MNQFIEGEKICLRAFVKSDIPVWFDWFNDSLVTEYMNKGAFPNRESTQEEYFNYLAKSKNDLQLAIILQQSDLLIGIIGVHKIDWVHRRGDVSILIGDKTQWGKGIAAEAISLIVRHAFTKMNLHRLSAKTPSLNAASRKSFENNGFILEGTRREDFFYKGSYADSHMLGLLREEWSGK